MSKIAGEWIAGGLFEPMLHRITPGADTETLDDRRYWWAPEPCRAMCVQLPPDVDLSRFPLCPKCFPDEPGLKGA